MKNGKTKNLTGISKAGSIEEIAKFWDSHSLSDYWDDTKTAAFEVRAIQRKRVTIDPDVYNKVETIANIRGVSAETLVNLWITEQLKKNGKTKKAA